MVKRSLSEQLAKEQQQHLKTEALLAAAAGGCDCWGCSAAGPAGGA